MDKEFLISGGISGAITDPQSKRATKHAKQYYDFIRSSKTDVDNIVKNTKFTRDQILMVKNYLFIFQHDLDGKTKRFDPCFEIAESWRRLAFDPKNIQPHDKMLISHELLELDYVAQGYNQNEAHIKASELYNYGLECNMFYEELSSKHKKESKSTQRPRIGGGLTLGYNTH